VTIYANSDSSKLQDVVTYKNGMEQFLTKLGPTDMFGEIGVFFNNPQPFTVRSKRLSQVVRISHHHFKQLMQPLNNDGRTIISNFTQNLKGLKKEVLEEIPFLIDVLSDLNMEDITSLDREQTHESENTEGTHNSSAQLNTYPMRVVIHSHHPDDNTLEGDRTGKLIHLPDTIEDLFRIAEKKFGKRGSTILMADASQVEDLNALRENDHLYIF
jgi:hypothetical protein